MHTPSPHSWWVQLLAIVLLILLVISWTTVGRMRGFVFAVLAAMLLAMVLSIGLSKLLKVVGVSAKVNQAITIGVACILSLIAVMSVSNFTIQSRRQAEQMDAVLPLRLEDLVYIAPEKAWEQVDEQHSPLVSFTHIWQRREYPQEPVEMEYIMIDVHFKPLWDVCLQDYLKNGAQTVDAAPWGARQAWQLEDRYEAAYLLCWDDRMVYMELEEAPDDTQKAIIGGKLKP